MPRVAGLASAAGGMCFYSCSVGVVPFTMGTGCPPAEAALGVMYYRLFLCITDITQ